MKHPKTQKSRFSLHFISSKRLVIGLLLLSLILSLFLALFRFNTSPPCINADEAAFGYNAYSLLKTGADEYGNTLPVRLKSFGDYKLPLYSYLSIPFIGVFGLNEIGIRALNILIALLFPIAVYFFTKELFEKDEVGAVSALFVSVSLGKGIIERHAHEALLAAFLVTISAYFFLKFLKKEQLQYGIYFIVSIFLALFSYQSSRLFAAFFLVFAIVYFILNKKLNKVRAIFLIMFIFIVGVFAVTDVLYSPERVKNLLLFNSTGFNLKIDELRGEGGHPVLYNKATIGAQEILNNELMYFSPQFLAANGDANLRFGFPGMAPMTPLEYIFIFIGLYYLFKNKERWKYFLLILIAIAPLSAALSWADASLTRSVFLLVPLLIVSAYGAYNILLLVLKRKKLVFVLPVLLLIESLFLFYSWDFYFNHYPQRAIVTRSWQCGYKELSTYIQSNYDKYTTFYITQKNGEPYIFTLFYLNYPPDKYQKQASLSAPDEYGFGQVEKFDKFHFSFPSDAVRKKNVVLIGYPDDFNQLQGIDTNKIKKIIIGKEEIFWIYET